MYTPHLPPNTLFSHFRILLFSFSCFQDTVTTKGGHAKVPALLVPASHKAFPGILGLGRDNAERQNWGGAGQGQALLRCMGGTEGAQLCEGRQRAAHSSQLSSSSPPQNAPAQLIVALPHSSTVLIPFAIAFHSPTDFSSFLPCMPYQDGPQACGQDIWMSLPRAQSTLLKTQQSASRTSPAI